MRKIILTMFLLTAATAVFASGTQDQTATQRGIGIENGTEITIDGTLSFADNHLTLESDKGIYSLSAPGAGRMTYGLEEGLAVTVNGQLTDCIEDCPFDVDGHIFVTSAVIDGETIDFEQTGRMGGFSQNKAPQGRSPRGRAPRGRVAQPSYGRRGGRSDS